MVSVGYNAILYYQELEEISVEDRQQQLELMQTEFDHLLQLINHNSSQLEGTTAVIMSSLCYVCVSVCLYVCMYLYVCVCDHCYIIVEVESHLEEYSQKTNSLQSDLEKWRVRCNISSIIIIIIIPHYITD